MLVLLPVPIVLAPADTLVAPRLPRGPIWLGVITHACPADGTPLAPTVPVAVPTVLFLGFRNIRRYVVAPAPIGDKPPLPHDNAQIATCACRTTQVTALSIQRSCPTRFPLFCPTLSSFPPPADLLIPTSRSPEQFRLQQGGIFLSDQRSQAFLFPRHIPAFSPLH